MTCPRCGRADTVRPIRYGLPSPSTEAAAERGEVILGGCQVGSGDPTHHCRACGQAFGSWPADEDRPR